GPAGRGHEVAPAQVPVERQRVQVQVLGEGLRLPRAPLEVAADRRTRGRVEGDRGGVVAFHALVQRGQPQIHRLAFPQQRGAGTGLARAVDVLFAVDHVVGVTGY